MTPSPVAAVQHKHPSSMPAMAAAADLDTQIEQLEQRLVAREAWLRATAESLAHRTKLAVTPKPWVLPAVGAGVVLWLGWRWWHRQHPARQAVHRAAPPVREPHVDGPVSLPWAAMTAFAWPMVPVAWRARVSPAAATAIASTVVSVASRLLRRRRR